MTQAKPRHTILPAILLTFAVPQFAHAQATSSLSGLYACEALTTPDAQLSCFRAETAKLRAGEGLAPVLSPPVAAPAPRVSAPTPRAPEFAPLATSKDKAKAPKERTMAIRSVSTLSNGYARFTLENGEVWQQIEKARLRMGKGSPDSLTLKRKSFGSFIGTMNGKRPSFRVRRVE